MKLLRINREGFEIKFSKDSKKYAVRIEGEKKIFGWFDDESKLIRFTKPTRLTVDETAALISVLRIIIKHNLKIKNNGNLSTKPNNTRTNS